MNDKDVVGEMTTVDALALLATTDPVSYYRSVAELARADHGSLLQPLPYSVDQPSHSPSCVSLEPQPAPRDELHLMGRAAYRDFDAVLGNAFADPAVDHLMTDLHHRLVHDEGNVAIVTNHGDIIDIALVLGAVVMALGDPDRSFGVLGEHASFDAIVARTNVLVSRMVTTRQVFSIPTVEVLQKMARVFLSVPQTQSRRRSKLTPELVRANNIVMREALTEQLALGGQLLAMAASGSKDLSLAANLVQRVRDTWKSRRGEAPTHGSSLHLQPLYRGTISLMLSTRDVLPVALSLDPSHPCCVIGGLTRVRDEDDCHRVMEWIAQAHEGATGVNTVYHRNEDQLLEQVRTVMRS